MTLSARSEATTRRTYNRPMDPQGSKFETWGQTIKRSQYDHHINLWEKAQGRALQSHQQSELMETLNLGLDRSALVAGRTLWLGGTDYAYSRAASQFNCAGLEICTVYDMVDAFWLLLNGCGVGGIPRAGTLHGYQQRIPFIQVIPSEREKEYRGHQQNVETAPSEDNDWVWTIKFGDSAEAWAKALGKMLVSPRCRVNKLVLDFSNVRGKGGRLKGYGWICNGDEPLAQALLAVHQILNENAGQLLGEEQISDIFNWCGTVLSSRRAAEALELDAHHPHAYEFSRRKFEYWKTPGQPRRQSNNSLLFWQRPAVSHLEELLEMNLYGGEPGFVNALAALLKCPWFKVFNPCLTGDTLVATADGRNAVPIKQLAEESQGEKRFDVYCARPNLGGKGGEWKTEISSAVAIMTGVKQIGLMTLSNGDTLRLTPDHRVALADGTYKEAKDCVGLQVESFFTKAHRTNRRMINSESNGYAKQCRMIWERANGPKPEGHDIDHVDSKGGDALTNLQLLETSAHRAKTSAERTGSNNPMHRIKDKEKFRAKRRAATVGAKNPNHSGLSDRYIVELATVLHRDSIPVTITNLRKLDARVPQSFSKIVRGESPYLPPEAPTDTVERVEEPIRREVVTVVSFVLQGEEPVYDLIVEKNRNFYVITSGDESNNYLDSKGLLVHNCFEICLASHGFCNLVSVAMNMFGRDINRLLRAVYLMARANYRQTCVDLRDGVLQPRWHQTNEALRLCGVSFTGVVQASWITDYQITQLRNTAVSGAYSMADELGLPRPKAVTTIKPEGTRSKITGHVGAESAEGIHMPLGRHIFNWINFAVSDPLVGALSDAGYKVIPNPSDSANVLVRFPVEFPGIKFDRDKDGREVNRESAVSQLERYKRWNTKWADHNVSSTISFDETEIKDMARWIHSNWDQGYVATAFTARIDPSLTPADVGHPYLPQEVVTAEEFARVSSGLKTVNWDDFHHGIYEIGDASDCASGVCPVK